MFLFRGENLQWLSPGYFTTSGAVVCGNARAKARALYFARGYFGPPMATKYSLNLHQAEMYMYWVAKIDKYQGTRRQDESGTYFGPFAITSDSVLYKSTRVDPCDLYRLHENGYLLVVDGNTPPISTFIALSLVFNGAHLEY
jgi:hypothetical protein